MNISDEKHLLRKAKDAVSKFNEAKATYEATINWVSAFHDAIRPLLGEIGSYSPAKNHPLELKADYSVPIRNQIIVLGKNTPVDEIKNKLELISDELTRAGIALEETRKNLESRHKHLKTISAKGGLSK